jgi:hypothetical protein
MMKQKGLLAAFLGFVLISATAQAVMQEPQLTTEQMKEFLLTAKVVKSQSAPKGITGVSRLLLSDGKITHEAAFQSIDESKLEFQGRTGTKELNFRDSYKFNVAAYELATMLGIGDMMPVTVVRKLGGKIGSLSWWLPAKMDEEKRLKQKIPAPDVEAWNRQMYRMRVFTELIYDTDRNLGNVLISNDWRLWMIDFTRAFRRYYDLQTPQNLVRCDRQLLANLRKLDARELTARTKGLLIEPEIKGLMMRRDKIVKFFDEQVAQKGESEVLY